MNSGIRNITVLSLLLVQWVCSYYNNYSYISLLLLIAFLCAVQLQQGEGTYNLEIRAGHYSNPEHKEASGHCCESSRRSGCITWLCGHCECDNRFDFCVRRSGTRRDGNTGYCPLGSYKTGEVGEDSFDFRRTGVPNPMTFTGSVWPVRRYVVLVLLSSCLASMLWIYTGEDKRSPL